jgi:L-asparagine oxygenase
VTAIREASELRCQITKYGYALMAQHRPSADIIEVANEFGIPLTPWEDGLVQTLTPRKDADPNTYSGNFGLGDFPFHTDLAHWRRPPRYLLLRCLVGYNDVPTLLVDGHALIDAISRDNLSRAIFKPRRPRDGAFDLLRLFEPMAEGADLLRWDEIFLRPASKVGDTVDGEVREWLANCEPLAVGLVRRGDTLIIDNWRMLHARSSIPLGREDRSIQRVYLGALN